VGTPQELFDHPQTVFAAHFMGAANVIEAEFRESAENFSMIQWSGATLRVHGSPAHMQQPMVLFRPSSLRLSYEATPSSLHSSLPCIIQARAYHGFTWQYRVQVKDATGQLPQTVEVWSADEFAIGTQLFLHVPAESGRLVEGGETAKLTHLGG
jgi:ABC-type Fe3+/spermidine/putrescine transport system ATPase subunit